MLPKAHLTSYSSISGFTWETQASSLSQSLWPFLYSSSALSCHLFLISSASVKSLTFLPLLCPSLHVVFLWYLHFAWRYLYSLQFYYFPLILTVFTYENFLISPCYSLEVCIPFSISFPFSFAFHFSYFLSCFKASSCNPFSFSYLFFLGMVLVTTSCTLLQTSIHSSSGFKT